MHADLVRQIGELAMDCEIQHATIGDLDNSVPESLNMKYKVTLSKGKDKGKEITNRIVFSSSMMGKSMSKEDKKKKEWDLYEQSGGEGSDQRIYMVNPYQFARTFYTMYVDPDQIIRKSMGLERQEKLVAFNIMTDPRVAPFTDRKAVIDDFAIEEYGGDDPDRYKIKDGGNNDMLNAIMGGQSPGGSVVPPAAGVTGIV
jgi:hypothetical protein